MLADYVTVVGEHGQAPAAGEDPAPAAGPIPNRAPMTKLLLLIAASAALLHEARLRAEENLRFAELCGRTS